MASCHVILIIRSEQIFLQGLVVLVLLSRTNTRYLLDACNSKAIPIIERLARDKDTYVSNAFHALQIESTSALGSIMQQVCSCLEIIVA